MSSIGFVLLRVFATQSFAPIPTSSPASDVYVIAIPGIEAQSIFDVQVVANEITSAAGAKGLTVHLISSFDQLDALVRNPPSNVIVINGHGETVPIPMSWGTSWQPLYDQIASDVINEGWTFVSIVGYPFYWVIPQTNENNWSGPNPGQDGLSRFLSGVGGQATTAWAATNSSLTSAGSQAASHFGLSFPSTQMFARAVSWQGVIPVSIFYDDSSSLGASAIKMGNGYFTAIGLPGNASDRLKADMGVAFAFATTRMPDFQLFVTPTSTTVTQGRSLQLTVTAQGFGGYDEQVSLDDTVSGAGLTASFTGSRTVLPTAQGTQTVLTLSVSPDATVGQWTLTIFGQDADGRFRQATASIQVNAFTTALIDVDSLSTDKAAYSATDPVQFSFVAKNQVGWSVTVKPIIEVLNVVEWDTPAITIDPHSSTQVSFTAKLTPGWPSGTKTWGVIVLGPLPGYYSVLYDMAVKSTFEDTQDSYSIQIGAYTTSENALPLLCISGAEIYIGTSSSVFRKYVTPDGGSTVIGAVPAVSGASYSVVGGVYAYGSTKHNVGGDGFVFDHWETSGGVAVSSDSSPSTTITVTGDGSLNAIFVRISVDTFKVDQQGNVLQIGSSASVTLTFSASVNWSDEQFCKYCSSSSVYLRAFIQGWGSDGNPESWYLPAAGGIQYQLGSDGIHTFTWPIDSLEQTTIKPLPGTYNVGLVIFDNAQTDVGNLPTNAPIGGKVIEFAFALDKLDATYAEIYGNTQQRVIHIHFASKDVCPYGVCATNIIELMTKVNIVNEWQFVLSAFSLAVASNAGQDLRTDFLNVLTDTTGHVLDFSKSPSLNQDDSYDIVIYQTLTGDYHIGTYYEGPLPKVVNLHQFDVFFTTMDAEFGLISIVTLLLAIPTLGVSLAIEGGLMLGSLAWTAVEHTLDIPDTLFNGRFQHLPAYGCWSGSCQFTTGNPSQLGSEELNSSDNSATEALLADAITTRPYGPDGVPYDNITVTSLTPRNLIVLPGANVTIDFTYQVTNGLVLGENVQFMLVYSWGGWPPMNYTLINAGFVDQQTRNSFSIVVPRVPGTYYAFFVVGSGTTVSEAIQGFTYDLLFTSTPQIEITVMQNALNLSPGWNLVSLPLVPSDKAISSVLKPLLAKKEVISVWSYEGKARGWQNYFPGKASTLTTMSDGYGYWIDTRSADVLYINGTIMLPASVPPTYQLTSGWNLVGFKPQPSVQSETVGQYLSSINGKYDPNNVWIYDNLNGTWVRGGASNMLQPGQAMWVLMTTPATLRP